MRNNILRQSKINQPKIEDMRWWVRFTNSIYPEYIYIYIYIYTTNLWGNAVWIAKNTHKRWMLHMLRKKIQSSAVITRPNFSRYYIRHCDNSGGMWINFRITTDTPYLALTGELWSVYCEDLGENWPRYNGTALYLVTFASVCGRHWCSNLHRVPFH